MTFAAVAASFVVALSTRSQANASTAGDPRIAVLQKQVKTLQAQVRTLTSALIREDNQVKVNFAADTCLAAQTADLFQGTWGVVDQLAQAMQHPAYFGAQAQVSDYGNCGQLATPDVPRGPVAVPPKIDPLLPLLQWLHE
jgi:hypothetical protein